MFIKEDLIEDLCTDEAGDGFNSQKPINSILTALIRELAGTLQGVMFISHSGD
jgi:hypothetical protein